jgi:hypothetical protein
MNQTIRARRFVRVFAVFSIVPALFVPGSVSAAKKPNTTNRPEIVSPGDIPDNIAFIPFAPPAAGYRISTPEGWSRRTTASGAVFTDKYNIVQVERISATPAPTVASVKAALNATFATTKGFGLTKVSTVKRRAGTAVLATFLVASAPNDVTGKSIAVAVERYEFHRAGTSVVVTLSGAKGADNVDPWRTITNSFAWT